jgi:hypothetical protein
MAATLATLNAVTKEIYTGSLQKQLNDDVVTLRRIEKTSDGTSNEVGGRYVTFPIQTRRNTGIGARNENEALPSAGYQGTAAARVGLKYLYGAIELTGQTIALIDKNYQAFISAVDLETEGIKADLAVDLNRQVYGTSKGTIGTVVAIGTAVVTVTVDRADLFQVGELVDIITLPSTVAVEARTVVSINLTTKVLTLDAAVTTAVGQILVRNGNVDREWTGLGNMVTTTGVLYNIDPTAEPTWTGNDNNNAGTLRAVSESMFTKFADDIRTRGGSTSVIFTTLGVQRAYAALLQQQRQFVNTTKFAGGWSGISFTTSRGEIPVVADVSAPPSSAWFLNEPDIKLYREADWAFMDYDGSKWQRKITSSGEYDAYTSRLFQYSELGTRRRNTHGVIRDLIEG